jgi:opacity protein-like surface antigen
LESRIVLKKFLVLGVMLGSAAAMAQVAPSSHGGNATLWVGAEFSSFDPDYDGLETLGPTQRLIGPGAFIDFNLTPKLGVEGETHWLRFNGNGGETQNDYLAGVKYRVFRWNKLSINAKFLLGGVWIKYPVGIGSGSYFAYAPGALVDYRLSRRFSVRGDYEYQFIPSAPGLYPDESNGLSPNGFSVGVAYRLLGIR